LILTIGLGPIGASVAANLADAGSPVGGLDLDADRSTAWSQATGAPAWARFESVDWAKVDTVLIAVRLAHQVTATFAEIARNTGDRRLSVFVLTTLGLEDARRILPTAPESWRTFEAPISGGPRGAREGTMTVYLAGPALEASEERLLGTIAGRVFPTEAYGQPALLKLCNNALGAYNAISTATMLSIAVDSGVPAAQFLEVVCASSGQSWMSDNFHEFHDDLLFKDVGLLLGDGIRLPPSVLEGRTDLSETIAEARALLSAHPEA
jgi:putative dehydrogenase